MHGERVGERREPGIERAAGRPQRLLGLQHDRELDEIEAAHVNERAGALLGGHAGGVGKGVADLPQGHQPERRRQVERRLR